MSKTEDPDDKKKDKKKSNKVAEARLEQLRKAMGISEKDDSVRMADQHLAIKDLISTGMPELDAILTPMIYEQKGIGGIPRGFVHEFFGPHAGGKSSLCMKLAANVTQRGGYVVWIDAEGSYVPEWAARHGVINDHVYYVDNTGQTGETFLERAEAAAATGTVELIVIDSLAALQPKEVMECPLEKDARMGAAARMMTKALPRIIAAAKKGNTAVIFINQVRMMIGVMYGNPETTPGGKALGFFSSTRLRISQVGSKKDRGIMKGDEDIGIRSNVRIEKSRFGPPFRECIMPIYYSDIKPHPLDIIIDAALQSKVVKSRSKTTENGEKIHVFSFSDIKSEGIDVFKNELTPAHIKVMATEVLAQAKIKFDDEIREYIRNLDKDDPAAVDTNTEGDPGA